MAKRVEPIDRWTGERQRTFEEQVADIADGLDDDDDYFDDEEPYDEDNDYDEDAGLEDT